MNQGSFSNSNFSSTSKAFTPSHKFLLLSINLCEVAVNFSNFTIHPALSNRSCIALIVTIPDQSYTSACSKKITTFFGSSSGLGNNDMSGLDDPKKIGPDIV